MFYVFLLGFVSRLYSVWQGHICASYIIITTCRATGRSTVQTEDTSGLASGLCTTAAEVQRLCVRYRHSQRGPRPPGTLEMTLASVPLLPWQEEKPSLLQPPRVALPTAGLGLLPHPQETGGVRVPI